MYHNITFMGVFKILGGRGRGRGEGMIGFLGMFCQVCVSCQPTKDHTDPTVLADSCKAVLTAGLYPNVAFIRRRGKGHTIQGLPVVVHPGGLEVSR